MSDQPHDDRQEIDDPIAYRDLSDQLPNEALREELERMTPEEREAVSGIPRRAGKDLSRSGRAIEVPAHHTSVRPATPHRKAPFIRLERHEPG